MCAYICTFKPCAITKIIFTEIYCLGDFARFTNILDHENFELYAILKHVVQCTPTYIDNDRYGSIVHGLGAVRPEVGTLGQVNIAWAETE